MHTHVLVSQPTAKKIILLLLSFNMSPSLVRSLQLDQTPRHRARIYHGAPLHAGFTESFRRHMLAPPLMLPNLPCYGQIAILIFHIENTTLTVHNNMQVVRSELKQRYKFTS